MKENKFTRILVVSLILLMILSGFAGIMNANGANIHKISSTSNKANSVRVHLLDTSFSNFKFRQINQKDINKMLQLREKWMELNENSSVKNEVKHQNFDREFKNYTPPIIDGHGTGLILPDKKEIENLMGHKMIVGVDAKVKEPSSVRWDLDPHFPPVGDQKWQGSCVAWAVSYYQNGFLQRMIYNWTDDSPAHLMSPAWTYNKANGGKDDGSMFEGNMEVIKTVGDATLANMSYNPSDFISWGSESAWRDAPKHRIANYYTIKFNNDNGIEAIKELLREGYLVTFYIDAYQLFYIVEHGNYIISLQDYNSDTYNHAQTIVGYDDNITDDGDVGAFRVVNSWGSSWGDHGFYWITYKALENKVSKGWPYAYVLVPLSKHPYNPKLLATWHFSNPGPRDALIRITIGSQNSNNSITPVLNGGNYSFPKFMALDITEFYNEWVNSSYADKFYLKIGSSSSGYSIVDSFKIEYYPYGYKYLWQNSTESPYVPATTPAVIPSAQFSPSEYFPYVHLSLVKGIAHIYKDSLKYPVWIGNAGNKSDTILINVSSINGWSVSLPARILFSPGENEEVNMNVQLPSDAKLGDSSHITIIARSENDTSKVYKIEFNAYYVSRPIHIENDTDFAEQAQKYGWPGDGSKNNPYIINDLYIFNELTPGIYMKSTHVYAVINGAYIENAEDSIYLENSSNIVIKNSILKNAVNSGIYLYSSSNITISNNNCSSNMIGVYLSSSSNNTISNNICTHNSWDGIWFLDSENNTVFNNICNENNIGGILVWSSSNNTISNNTLGNNNKGGIFLYASSNNNTASNNTCNNDFVGIFVWGSHNNMVVSNICNNNKDGIFVAASSNNTLFSNTCNNNNYGIYFPASSTNNTVSNNTCSNNSVGIWLGSSRKSILSNNTCSNNENGIYLLTSSDNAISNNTCNNNVIGIFLWYSRNNTISSNIFANNSDYGIYIKYGTSNNLIYNNFFRFNHGSGDTYNSSHIQAYDDGTNNAWNSSSGVGNYWYDWASNNNTNDKNHDGVVDWPYPIAGSAGAKDYYPLMCSVIGESVPSQPYNLSASFGDEYVNLTWDMPVCNGSSPISQYRIYRNGTLIATVSATQLYYNDTKVENGVNYTYYVTAGNSAGESQPSNIVYATPMTIPTAPQNLQARAGNGYVNLSWEVPSDNGGSVITGYRVYRNGTLIAIVPATQLWYNDTKVENGVNYTYYVTVINSAGESSPSNKVEATPRSVPSAPQNLRAKVGNSYVNLTWSAPADNGGAEITEYRVYRNGTLIATVPGDRLWYNDTKVIGGKNYTYYVTAVNSVGESRPSNEVSAIPKVISSFPIAWIVIAVVIILIAIGIILAVMIYKKKT